MTPLGKGDENQLLHISSFSGYAVNPSSSSAPGRRACNRGPGTHRCVATMSQLLTALVWLAPAFCPQATTMGKRETPSEPWQPIAVLRKHLRSTLMRLWQLVWAESSGWAVPFLMDGRHCSHVRPSFSGVSRSLFLPRSELARCHAVAGICLLPSPWLLRASATRAFNFGAVSFKMMTSASPLSASPPWSVALWVCYSWLLILRFFFFFLHRSIFYFLVCLLCCQKFSRLICTGIFYGHVFHVFCFCLFVCFS